MTTPTPAPTTPRDLAHAALEEASNLKTAVDAPQLPGAAHNFNRR
jgi:hypothetical protein